MCVCVCVRVRVRVHVCEREFVRVMFLPLAVQTEAVVV